MKIVNGHLARSIREQGMLQEPNDYGYIHLAAEVEAPHPLRRMGVEKKQLINALYEEAKALCAALTDQVQRVDVFTAFVIPPGSSEGRRVLARQQYPVHVARFDVVVLVECTSPDVARQVREHSSFASLQQRMEQGANFTHCFVAKNAKRIAEVDKTRDGVFLFNYFYAADVKAKGATGIEILLGVWEYTAGWWTAYANLDNSTPLQPLAGEKSEYSLVNHCRWDRLWDVLPHLLFRPSLGKFVLANFTANEIVAMPVLYRLAKPS